MSKFFDQAKANKKIVAIGERGLDYHRPNSKSKTRSGLLFVCNLDRKKSFIFRYHSFREAAGHNDSPERVSKYPGRLSLLSLRSDYARELWDMGVMTVYRSYYLSKCGRFQMGYIMLLGSNYDRDGLSIFDSAAEALRNATSPLMLKRFWSRSRK